MCQVKEELERIAGIPRHLLVLCDIFRSKVHRVWVSSRSYTLLLCIHNHEHRPILRG